MAKRANQALPGGQKERRLRLGGPDENVESLVLLSLFSPSVEACKIVQRLVMSPSPQSFRRELEDVWRERVQAQYRLYRSASEQFRKVLEEQRHATKPSPDGNQAVFNALELENSARKEYMRVVRIFSDLTLRGKIPEEE
jgi:hypothetical protein